MTETIGLVVAMSAEGKVLVGRGPWERAGRYAVHRSRLADTRLIIVRSGIGRENASAACRWLIREGVGVLGSAGICAGLAPQLVPGDLIIADGVIEEAGERCRYVWRDPVGFAESACGALRQAGFRACAGPIVTVQEPVLSKEDKGSLHQRSKALAADMESAAAALAAREASLPYLAFRAVCDGAGRSIPSGLFDSLHRGGRIRPAILIQSLLLRPVLFAHLLQMAREFGAALSGLRRGWNDQLKYRVTSLLAT